MPGLRANLGRPRATRSPRPHPAAADGWDAQTLKSNPHPSRLLRAGEQCGLLSGPSEGTRRKPSNVTVSWPARRKDLTRGRSVRKKLAHLRQTSCNMFVPPQGTCSRLHHVRRKLRCTWRRISRPPPTMPSSPDNTVSLAERDVLGNLPKSLTEQWLREKLRPRLQSSHNPQQLPALPPWMFLRAFDLAPFPGERWGLHSAESPVHSRPSRACSSDVGWPTSCCRRPSASKPTLPHPRIQKPGSSRRVPCHRAELARAALEPPKHQLHR